MPGTKAFEWPHCDSPQGNEAQCSRPMSTSELLQHAARELRERARSMDILADNIQARSMGRDAQNAFHEIVEEYLRRQLR